MTSFDVPPRLVDAIVEGRCVAFVGAGFSAGVMPTWSKLLAELATRLDVPRDEKDDGALGNELLGQQLQQRAERQAPGSWEPLVKAVLDEHLGKAGEAARADLARRCAAVRRIPFKAILTTNFDPTLQASFGRLDASAYGRLLRHEQGRWWNAPRHDGAAPAPPVVKLHGDANGDPQRLPLVLGREDYRTRVYGDRNYANFLRAVFSAYTVLFLGVSFTDAYLNELRSEVLHLVGTGVDGAPWGYAVSYQPPPTLVESMRAHEGIHLLRTTTHAEFVQWLEAIAARTSVEGRLRTLLDGERLVWVDRNHAANNGRGFEVLPAGAVVRLDDPGALSEAAHGQAAAIVTSFGHAEGLAFAVLDRVNGWRTRPPVLVFASPDPPESTLRANRRACLRRGAWEYAVEWSELFRALEVLLARTPGQPDRFG
jgi:hypothetical protein